MQTRFACLAAAAMLIAACSSSSESIVGPPIVRANEPIQTDSVSYHAMPVAGQPGFYSFRIVTRYTNQWNAPVFLARCYPNSPTPIYGIGIVGDSTGSGRNSSAFNPSWGCVGHDQQI